MSSRVQKGGQKFKPVAKPRGRPIETSSVVFRNTLCAPEPASASKPSSTANVYERNGQSESSASLPVVPERVEGHLVSLVEEPTNVAIEEVQSQADNPADGGVDKLTPLTTSKTHTLPSTEDAFQFTSPLRPSDVEVTAPTRLSPIGSPRSQPIRVSSSSQTATAPQPTSLSTQTEQGVVVSVLQPSLQNVFLGNARQPSGTSQAHSSAVLPGAQVSKPPNQDNDIESQAGPSTLYAPPQAHHPSISPTTRHKSRVGPGKSRRESDVGGDGDEGNRDTGRQAIKQKLLTKPRKSTESTVGETMAEPGQGMGRSKRRRRSAARQSTAGEHLDAVDLASGTEGGGSESEGHGRRKRRERSTTGSLSTRDRRSRNPSVPIFDPDADPGDDLDPTVVTMADICDDTGQGRLSSKAAVIQRNHLAWKALNKEKRGRMRARMEAKKYGRKEDDAEGGEAESSQAVEETNPETHTSQTIESSGTPAVEDVSGSGFNYRETLATNRFNVQVRIGPNGETIIDEESLYVDRNEDADDATDKYQHIEESDQTKFTNSASYGKKLRGSRWSVEETELFYDALSQFGENYELISYVLPGRDRKSCKNKFKTEDKKNPNRITFCLNNRVPYDMQTLSRLTGRDFSGPTPEIRMPEVATLVEEFQAERSESERSAPKKVRKKSRTPGVVSDVEVVGDIDTFNLGLDD
ncbi:hypothetical protein M0805_007169 [Coniferiporia weirii]|nr:hypothetical protein M0805_007169 [Coniferiporia weirii]